MISQVMSGDFSDVTRGDDFYESVMRSKVINETDCGSRIVDFNSDISWNIDWFSKWDLLKESGSIEVRTTEELIDVLREDPITLTERVAPIKAKTSHEWKSYVDSFDGLVRVALDIELPDGECISVSCKELSIEVASQFYRSYLLDEMIDVKRVSDGFEISLEGVSALFEDGKIRVRSRKGRDDEDVLYYYSCNSNWVKGRMGSVKENSGTVRVPIELQPNVPCKSETFLEYDEPEADDSGFYDLVEYIGSGNPLGVENKTVYVGFEPNVSRGGLTTDGLWVVTKTDFSSIGEGGLIQRVKSSIPKFR